MTILNGITRLYPSEGLALMETSQMRSDTFHRRRIVVRTSTFGVVGRASTLRRGHSLAHRVELDSQEQGRRANDAASRTSIGGGWGADIDGSFYRPRCRCMQQGASIVGSHE